MFRHLLRRATAAAAVLLPAIGSVPAQAAEKGSAPIYRSAFDNYRAWRAEEPSADWRQANEAMGQLGGHAGHLRGAPTATPSNATSQPPPGDPPEAKERDPQGTDSEVMHNQHGMPRHDANTQGQASRNKGSGQ
ncbi:MAG TPA: hypothetical protein VFR86_23420 [Burkholderiaceae bacterium]|nr:hypothetical protein [Burkholderiaceae bacterium]